MGSMLVLQVSGGVCCPASLVLLHLESSQGVIFHWQVVEHFYLLCFFFGRRSRVINHQNVFLILADFLVWQIGTTQGVSHEHQFSFSAVNFKPVPLQPQWHSLQPLWGTSRGWWSVSTNTILPYK